MNAVAQRFAEAATVLPPRNVTVAASYVGPLRPFGKGLVPNSTGNGWNILMENPLNPTEQCVVLVFSEAQYAVMAEMHEAVKGGDEFRCAIAGRKGGAWNDVPVSIELREDEEGNVTGYAV